MKKILYIFLASMVVAAWTGCSDDDKDYQMQVLELESSDVIFDFYGGEGSIVAKVSGITAIPDADWIETSVSGNKVTVKVGEYRGEFGRYGSVKVTANGISVDVPVTQTALEVRLGIREVLLGENESVDVPYTTISPITTVDLGGVSWLSYEIKDGYVTLTTGENDLLTVQETIVRIGTDDMLASSTVKVSIAGRPLRASDVFGVYKFSGMSYFDEEVVVETNITFKSDGTETGVTILNHGTNLVGASTPSSISATLNIEDRTIHIPNLQYFGFNLNFSGIGVQPIYFRSNSSAGLTILVEDIGEMVSTDLWGYFLGNANSWWDAYDAGAIWTRTALLPD